MHLNRKKSPKTWPIPKKGTKYIVAGAGEKSIPLLVVLRDIMKLARTKKEVKKILNEKLVRINGKIIRDEKYPLILFDVISLRNKNYRIILKNKKFDVEETKSPDEKIAKVINKILMKRKKVQINLSDGRNYITDKKIETGDSVIIDLKNKKIKDVIKFEEGAKVVVIDGKHIGKEGIIEKINERICEIKHDNEKINVKKDYLMAIK